MESKPETTQSGSDDATISTLISDSLSAINGSRLDEDIPILNEVVPDWVASSSTQEPSPVVVEKKESDESNVELYRPAIVTDHLFIQSNNNNANTVVASGTTQCPPMTVFKQDPDLPPPSSLLHQTQSPITSSNITRLCSRHPHIEVTLDGKELWDAFYRKGTEMIVNRAGRRMFPGFAVSISGLKPKAKYTMKLDIMLRENHRFKFLNARWLPVGSAEPQPQFETYVHPDSPNTGSFWMRHGISFRKLKITNNKDKPGGNALLHSMHKYFLRLLIEEEKRNPAGGEPKAQPRPILTMEFPETEFIAVTAYQNEEVTQLKISNNPFAKAFRENSGDILDWETAQALYGNSPSCSYLSPAGPLHHSPAGNYFMSPSPSWALPSPVSPHPLHHLHHPISAPVPGTSHYSPESPQFRHSLPVTPQTGYFQWPQQHLSRHSELYMPPYIPRNPLPQHPIETTPNDLQLPDFGTSFTTSHS